MEVHTGETQT